MVESAASAPVEVLSQSRRYGGAGELDMMFMQPLNTRNALAEPQQNLQSLVATHISIWPNTAE
jgi:hypothetical protein